MNSSEQSGRPKRHRGVVIFLSLLPLWLLGSTVVGLWLWNRGGEVGEEAATRGFRTPISTESLQDDLRKLTEIVGPRHAGTEAGATGLRRAASMIEGSLGPGNAGYKVQVEPGPETPNGSWPIIIARLPGSKPGLAVLAGYDANPAGGGVEANATGVASTMAAAQALAGEELGKAVTFVFVPHAYELEGPVIATADRALGQLGDISTVLVVEATGADRSLMVSSRDTELLPAFEGLARIVGAEVVCLGEDTDPASVLFEMSAPAVRVSTRPIVLPDEADDVLPKPEEHVEATRRLTDLIRRLASADSE